jgi:carbon storage regulator CsrA
VLKIRGSQVHLGIDAPKRAAVHRKEVWIRIQNEAAAEAEAEAKAGDGANVTHINK